MIIAILSVLMLQPSDEAAWEALRARIETSPREIATFIARRANCNHFAGEEPYDRQRAKAIRKAMRELRCASVETEESALRGKHRDQAKVLQLLDDTQDILGW